MGKMLSGSECERVRTSGSLLKEPVHDSLPPLRSLSFFPLAIAKGKAFLSSSSLDQSLLIILDWS